VPRGKIVRDYIAEMENMVNVFDGIGTAEDAEKAKSELKAIGGNIKTIIRRKGNLGGPSPALEKTLKEKYGKQHTAKVWYRSWAQWFA